MEINKNITVLLDALKILDIGIRLFNKYEKTFNEQHSEENEQLFTSMRDSLIHRFKYNTNLFWETTNVYLITIEKMNVPLQTPRGIIREAVTAGLFSEEEGIECMNMVEARNKTSHTYHEEIADKIAHVIPTYYELIKKLTDRIHSNLD